MEISSDLLILDYYGSLSYLNRSSLNLSEILSLIMAVCHLLDLKWNLVHVGHTIFYRIKYKGQIMLTFRTQMKRSQQMRIIISSFNVNPYLLSAHNILLQLKRSINYGFGILSNHSLYHFLLIGLIPGSCLLEVYSPLWDTYTFF